MAQLMLLHRTVFLSLTLVLLAVACHAQSQAGLSTRGQNKAAQEDSANATVPHAAEDISGMYSFVKEGEFLQITLEKAAVTGYISRMGDSDSDNGVFLDQFFARADVQGHDVSFTTRPLHSVWYEFKGRFNRGPGKTKGDDGYYILRGTLKELTTNNADKTVSSRSREVEFKLLAQPEDSDEAPAKAKKPK
ncbi:MAG TPA: hypothetical protein VIK39_08940 [Candidatus Angelobacter sp.]|jgi:hypothetical protein